MTAFAHETTRYRLEPAPDGCTASLLATKAMLGVPSLYYVEALDSTGEPFQAEDYAALRRAFG